MRKREEEGRNKVGGKSSQKCTKYSFCKCLCFGPFCTCSYWMESLAGSPLQIFPQGSMSSDFYLFYKSRRTMKTSQCRFSKSIFSHMDTQSNFKLKDSKHSILVSVLFMLFSIKEPDLHLAWSCVPSGAYPSGHKMLKHQKDNALSLFRTHVNDCTRCRAMGNSVQEILSFSF